MKNRDREIIEKEILTIIPDNIRNNMELIPEPFWNKVFEIRLRAGRVPSLTTQNGEMGINEILKTNSPDIVSQEDISKTLGLMSNNSIYAVQEEIRSGFLTLRGGHRVGLAGKVICDHNTVQTMKCFSSLNIRISRQIFGAADLLLGFLIERMELCNTLIISPPGCGKTTILRDAVRQISSGFPGLDFRGKTIGLVDERSELAACYKGLPQNDVGPRTDVLDNCPKAEGIMMLVRSMNPKIIATDEIGSIEDAKAITAALSAGISVICTAHGSSIEEILLRIGLNELVKSKVFKRIIVLGKYNEPGTIRAVYDGISLKPIYSRESLNQCTMNN